jgi:hypothetical protein
VKPLLFFREVSILVFFHVWTGTCSITTQFKLISFLSNYNAYCILSLPFKKCVIAICIEKYHRVKIWWWQVDSDHQNFVTFPVVCRQTFSQRSNTCHIFIMRWNRWSEYPQAKISQHNYNQQFFMLQGTSINFTIDFFSKVSRMVLGHIKPPTQQLLGDLSH